MTIRPLTQNDIEQCARLYVLAYNRPPWNYNFSHEKAVKYLTEYTERSRFVGFVLVEGDNIAGAMLGHSKTWWTNDLLYIDELFVAPESRGKGYGKSLLDHAEEYSREQGFEVITLMTNKHMPAFEFYNHIDYIQAEHFVFLFKPV
ncbi:GNAT family N-acetyltransferase [Mucilaginibacter ginsenosidivorans]|uniref:GNAT family N-acetyltransferase n=1 Tax=Mucilaginibacter ginsenosidivorans TaxID=398053 RepID=A0A5B8V007_9SPHI|nr:GNAT family N-acetyltransferase [Mucilaginibacter ginsenosidivorans]QEC64365.1 GNAT family N-acetyltransferase [Mucilaginibacter ginsenosidivorans]